MSRTRKIFWWTGGILLTLMLLSCMGDPVSVWIEALFVVAFGWVGFLGRVLPKAQIRWDIAAGAAVCIIAFVIGSHLFLRWLYRETGGDGPSAADRRWRWQWTFSGACLVLLMFSAGIGSIGVVHQTAWLATSPVPLVKYTWGERLNRTMCARNLQWIGEALQQYANDHGGRYPDDFRALFLDEGATSYSFVCPSSNDTYATGATTQAVSADFSQPGHCSYVFYGQGLSTPPDPNRVIAGEHLENHGGVGMNILFGDGHVEFVDADHAAKLLATLAPATQPTTPGQ